MKSIVPVQACLLPFFNAVVSLLGSLSFFPLTVRPYTTLSWALACPSKKSDLILSEL